MTGFSIGHKVARKVDIGARVAAIRRWKMEIRHAHTIRQDLEDFTDMGLLVEEEGPLTCTCCDAVIERGQSFCRRCGAEPGEQLSVNEQDSDNEFWLDELTPVHGVSEEADLEIPTELGLVEKIQESLLELGWNLEDAEDGGIFLAKIFEDKVVTDIESYVAEIQREEISDTWDFLVEKLLDPSVQFRMIGVAKSWLDATNVKIAMRKADIYIFKGDDGEWRVEAEDLLASRITAKPSAKVKLGELSVSLDKYLEILRLRPQRLRAIGEQLLRHFREDFFEQGFEQANIALKHRAMQQKKIARAADIPESTFSRWCDPEEGGVWVSTPHGPYHLGDFFRLTASSDKGGRSSRAGVIALVLEAKRELGGKIPDFGDKLSKTENQRIREWLEGHEIKMAERTLRGYWKDANATVRVARAMAELRERNQWEANMSAEKLRDLSGLDFNDRAPIDLYLQLAHFYSEQNWGDISPR